MAATAAGGGSNVGGQLSVELMRQKQLYDELVKKTQLLHRLQGSVSTCTITIKYIRLHNVSK